MLASRTMCPERLTGSSVCEGPNSVHVQPCKLTPTSNCNDTKYVTCGLTAGLLHGSR